MGAAFIFTCGRRYPKQASDTINTWKKIPLFEWDDDDELWNGIPHGCIPVAIEQTDNSYGLHSYKHPERAIYILGAEDTGVPPRVLERCRDVIEIPSESCLNVAVAGSIVLYDRISKLPA